MKMENNGFFVEFNMPDALSGEREFELPPYNKITPYLVDKYTSCPSNWMRSEGKAKSYFVPVEKGKGMWLDFNDNMSHTHHVAILVSIQGVNPITGMPCADDHLEQYIEKCPKHKVKFGPDRFCKKCNYKWPKQNYISSTGTPHGQLWIDGFRSLNGVVRQYILTQEKIRGVASNIIGKDRVYSIGVSFFISKEKNPNSTENYRSCTTVYSGSPSDSYPKWSYLTWKDSSSGSLKSSTESYSNVMGWGKESSNNYVSASYCVNEKGIKYETATSIPLKLKSLNSPLRSASINVKKLEVGAGAKIKQQIYDDPETLDFWRDESESVFYINYCTQKDAQKIINGGTVDLEGSKEGFLTDIPKGN